MPLACVFRWRMEFSLLDWPESAGVNVLLPCADDEWALCGAILLLVQAIWQAQLGMPNQNEKKRLPVAHS
jgi:hypothetical protein